MNDEPTLPDMTFTQLVDRGGLSYPTDDLYKIALSAYVVFNGLKQKGCQERVCRAVEVIYDHNSDYEFCDHSKIIRTLVNTYFNGYVRDYSDQCQSSAINARKRQKLSAH